MKGSARIGNSFHRLTFVVVSVAAISFFCIAAAPSATAQTYKVTITGGSAGGCNVAGAEGTLVISGGTLEFTSTSDCSFGTVGFDSGPSKCTNAASGLSCASLSIANVGANEYVFMDAPKDNAGACTSSTNCSAGVDIPGGAVENFTLTVNDANCAASGPAVCNLALGSVGGNTPVDVQFDDAKRVTPEPASFLLFGSGLLGLAAILRKRLRRSA